MSSHDGRWGGPGRPLPEGPTDGGGGMLCDKPARCYPAGTASTQSDQIVTFSLATNPLSALPLMFASCWLTLSLKTMSVVSETWLKVATLLS